MAPPPPSKPKPVAGPPVLLFPPVSKIILVRDQKLQAAVAGAVAGIVKGYSGPPAPFAITIVDPDNNYAMGGFNDDSEHYVASEVKVGVLYAAYALLDMVRRYNNLRNPETPILLFGGLKSSMGDAIERSSALVFGGVSPQYRVPNYESVFTASGPKGKVTNIDFSRSFSQALEKMIVVSDNSAAGECIHGIGYGYLNGALEQGQFFSPKDKKGVWVGGDFHKGWPYMRIPCDNDDDTAQGATSAAMARLMAVIVLGDVLPDDSRVRMTSLLRQAVKSDMLKMNEVTHAKIGYGPRNGGGIFDSEVCVVKGVGKKAGKTYVVAFQNLIEPWQTYALNDITKIVGNAIQTYES